MSTYNFSDIESKWQKTWEEKRLFEADGSGSKPKYYCLVMFPYPSGKLHMGHVRNYSIGDVFARFYRMSGRSVLHPIGWDAFGLPAENAAIKNRTSPSAWTRENIRQMGEQLKALGISYDWSRELATCDPEYYRWNQWFFIKMWEKGLVLRRKAAVNWCPSCATVLANEQVNQGRCWRCDSIVENKELEQWFLKITDYAEELLKGHEELEKGWPQEVLAMQKNWIGRSVGAEVKFRIVSDDGKFENDIEIFTTRPDTLFGATFMVLAPEHGIMPKLEARIRNADEVRGYVREAAGKSSIERTGEREKTGLKLEGVGAVNPVNGKKIPVFIADYVLMGYGTGAIMAVPAHDQRDWEFAVKYKVPIVEVIHSKDSSIAKCAYEGEGVMVNSGEFDGTPSVEGAEKVTKWLESKKLGKKAVNYRLKDWLISRQRYWGTPIPVIHCEKCGAVPVPEKDLPVVLPENVELTGEGKSPLSRIKDFIEVKCPKCGAPSKRETDTMDTFVDSSWYFARYTDAKNLKTPFDKKTADYWLPIDQYVGGVEHACMHLIYSRFWHKFMRDIGLLKSSEPFEKLLTQGMVTLGGAAMSKSRGNIVTPDEIIEKFGADTARLFILFAAPPEKQLDWSQEGLEGCWRFLNRVWRLIARKDELKSTKQKSGQRQERGSADAAVLKKTHQTIKKVTNDIVREHQLNTAISSIMELVNECYSSIDSCSDGVLETAQETVVLLLMPFAPHMCEELWEKMGHKKSLLEESWPESDEKYLIDDTIEIPVQVNGKLRATVSVVADITEEKLKEIVSVDPKITPYLEKGRLVKFIYVQKRIANLIVK